MDEKTKSLPRTRLRRHGIPLIIWLAISLPLLYVVSNIYAIEFGHTLDIYSKYGFFFQRSPTLIEKTLSDSTMLIAVLMTSYVIAQLIRRVRKLFILLFFSVWFAGSGCWFLGFADECLYYDGSQTINTCQHHESCQKMFDETYGVRVEIEHPAKLVTYSYIFLTKDGGQTWTSYATGGGWMVSLDCDNFSSQSKGFFWLAIKNFLSVTHDGGQTWHYWNSGMIVSIADTDYDKYGGMTVTFDSPEHGTMKHFLYLPSIPILHLTTNDGGMTWQLFEVEATKIE